ncbi:MAG: rod shape-determining protein [Candidatus Moraniibacteriota bacterium]|nr:MAG: rod shape-determining protein [Candidatus Moranbacteria bacterium]
MSFLENINIFHSSESNKRYLALDIGTDVVKALIFRFDKKEQRGYVIGVGKKQQRAGDMLSGGIVNIEGVLETSRCALNEALKASRTKHIDRAILGIAGELVRGTTMTVHYERSRPDTKIEISELKEIMRQVQLKAFERIQNQLEWETEQKAVDIKLINAAVVNVRIDGYKVSNPVGFQGKNVSISIFNAYSPVIHLGALETIADELGISSLSIVAEPYAVSRIFSSEDDRDFQAVFVDVGGGTTDIAVVRNGGLEGTKMFAIGGHSFTKHLAYEFQISFEEAERLKLFYTSGKKWEHERINPDSVHEIMKEDVNIWLGGLEISLGEFLKTDVLPKRILLCGGGVSIPEMETSMRREEWKNELFFSPDVEVTYLLPEHVSRMKDMTKKLTSSQDVTPLALANLMIEMLLEEKMLSNILRRTAKNIS